ncbi:hypothetical protein RJ640_010473, partial [Escallonia rubra]
MSGDGMGEEHHDGVSCVLLLSYNGLPYQLKSCFIYLGKFQEDSEIEAEKLYQLWMAEGMVLSEDQREGETLIDVAERYFAKMVNKCMINVSFEDEESSFRRFKSCRLHDVMRDLCLIKARKEDFFVTIDFQRRIHSPEPSTSVSNTRRLFIYHSEKDIGSKHGVIDKDTSRRLRTCLTFFIAQWKYKRRIRVVKSHPKMIINYLRSFNSNNLGFSSLTTCECDFSSAEGSAT